MDLVLLRTFMAAADTGSFAEAATRVHASPSSVSERIGKLEYRMGAKLFDRDKRGCRLTSAGRRFLAPASQALRALDIARQEVGLPESFTRSIALGGQYILWDRGLMDWLGKIRVAMPDLALRVTSGASTRLNRDLAEGFLDMAVLYDPVFRREIGAEPLFEDRLVLVTGGDPENWRDDYVRIEWGRELGGEIASRLDLAPETGLVLDLGARSAHWLISQRMAGYMPLSIVAQFLESGELCRIEAAPHFDYPAYVCWRRDLDQELAETIIAGLKGLGG